LLTFKSLSAFSIALILCDIDESFEEKLAIMPSKSLVGGAACACLYDFSIN